MHLYKEGNYTCEASSKYGTDKRVVLVEGEKWFQFNTVQFEKNPSPLRETFLPGSTDLKRFYLIKTATKMFLFTWLEIFRKASFNRHFLKFWVRGCRSSTYEMETCFRFPEVLKKSLDPNAQLNSWEDWMKDINGFLTLKKIEIVEKKYARAHTTSISNDNSIRAIF